MISPATVLAASPRTALTASAADALLDYLRKCVAVGWEISEQQFIALDGAVPPDRKNKIRRLRESSDQTGQQQRGRLSVLEPLLRGGNTERGRRVFAGRAGCATCHRVAGQGLLALTAMTVPAAPEVGVRR